MKFRFDTRDTKPRLLSLRILTAAAAFIVGALAMTAAERSTAAICIVIAAYALGMILALLWAFREQIRYNPYSYNTIFYFCFALFALIAHGLRKTSRAWSARGLAFALP